MVKKALCIGLISFIVGCTVTYTPEMVQHIKGSSFKATDTGYYTAELVMKPKQPVVGMNKAHLIIHNYEAVDIPGLRIIATPYLPSKGITSENAKVEDSGRGLYILEDVNLTEPGIWHVQLKIYSDEMSDKVTLVIPEVK